MRKEWTLFLTFLKIGAFTFGGGYAMIALLSIGHFLKASLCEPAFYAALSRIAARMDLESK